MTKGKYGLSLAAVAILSFVLAFFGFVEVLVLVLGFALVLEKDKWLSRQVMQAFYLRLAYSILLTVIGWVFTAFSSLFSLVKVYGAAAALSSVQSVISFLLYIGLFVLGLMAVLQLAKGKEANLPIISGLVDKSFGIFKPKAQAPVAPQPVPAAPVQQQTPPVPAPQAPAPAQQGAAATPPPAPVQAQEAAPAAPPAPVTPPAPVQETAPPAPPVPVQEEPPTQPLPVQEAPPPAPPAEKSQTPPAQPAPPPQAPVAADGWTCSCGRDNKGNFCMSCGKPRPK